MQTNGTCNVAFEAVRDAFVANFDAGGELGACVAVTVNGEAVVDLWAGLAASDGRPWERDTIVNVYSSTKTMASLCVLMLADRGKLSTHPSPPTGQSSRITARAASSSAM